MRRCLLEVTWGLEERPAPHLDAITGSPRLDDLMRHYYDELEEGQLEGLCAMLEDRYMMTMTTPRKTPTASTPTSTAKTMTISPVSPSISTTTTTTTMTKATSNDNDSNDNNNVSNNIGNADKNNNINNNNTNNNNNGDDCDLRDDGDDLRIQVVQVVATDNNDHFAGCDVNIYNRDSDGSGRWVQRAPSTTFVTFSGGWPFGEGITLGLFMSCSCRRGSIALLQWDAGGRVAG
ncbi:hypothetical protein CBR_g39616 [Chara braunii]|uniref:Uncharacterized protein n=1 Tax=Chara braunii TaxID=69332 RepID=A0A388K1A5_CHABU|nr:hypothetical protein CBR_g39616 [Chara braunii]|eukprot:GBG63831.1 hypothetical protein CBR_g39616 [Chara braunii]